MCRPALQKLAAIPVAMLAISRAAWAAHTHKGAKYPKALLDAVNNLLHTYAGRVTEGPNKGEV